MALDMHAEQGSERAKALLDSNARKHSCILEVVLVNGVFRAFILTLRRSEDKLTKISSKCQAHRSPLFPGVSISARTGKVLLRLVMISQASTVSTIINGFPHIRGNSNPSSIGLITSPFKTSPLCRTLHYCILHPMVHSSDTSPSLE
jgi:hypothetical protein